MARVWIVENQPGIRSSFGELFSNNKAHDVSYFDNIEAAQTFLNNILNNIDMQPDVLVVGKNYNLDGTALAAKIRERGYTFPIIITATTISGDLEKFKKNHADIELVQTGMYGQNALGVVINRLLDKPSSKVERN